VVVFSLVASGSETEAEVYAVRVSQGYRPLISSRSSSSSSSRSRSGSVLFSGFRFRERGRGVHSADVAGVLASGKEQED
jgi:hypothetical protein